MKFSTRFYAALFFTAFLFVFNHTAKSQTIDTSKFILQNDKDVAKEESGTHNGGGKTIGYNFFGDAKNLKTVFRKRTLKAGSSIGYHLQKEDEIYYVISGNGKMKMNGETFPVKHGDAILTRPGSSHGIEPNPNTDLTILIVYAKK
jgi:mannose-6-phosphate isomerase-like protein (cupin superfamily)